MTKWITTWRGAAFVLVTALALASGPGSPHTEALAAIAGSGPGSLGLLWACGVCAGSAAVVASSGGAGIVAYLALSANLGRITACIGACTAAFAI